MEAGTRPERPPELDEEARPDLQDVLRTEYETYVELRLSFEEADAVATERKKAYKAQEEKLWTLMENAEMKTMSSDVFGKVTRVNKRVATITDENALMGYLGELGILDRFRYQKWSQKELNGLVKTEMDEHGEPPPGLDMITPIQLSWIRPKGEPEAQRVEQED